MLSKYYKNFLQLFFLALATYILHRTVFFMLEINTDHFYYSLEKLYLVFFEMAALVYLILILIKSMNFERIGTAFLYLTFAQMLLGFLIIRPILKILSEEQWIEKCSFFISFILFLMFETILTIRLLNEKR